MADDVPSPGEIWRLLTKIDARLDSMSREFVRADVFRERQAVDAAESRGMQNELHKQSKRFESLESQFKAAERDVEQAIDAIEARRRADIRWALGLLVPLALGLLMALAANGAFL